MSGAGKSAPPFSTRRTIILILTRRAGESIHIGPDVTVTVMAINGNQVRIGVAAPRDVVVDREEIAERKAAGVPKPVTP